MLIIGNRKFLNTKELARETGVSINWLKRCRWHKQGPPYTFVPKYKTALYDFEIFQKWMIENMKDGEDE